MKKWLTILLTFLIFGCSDSFAPDVENVTGIYEVISLDGKDLPVAVVGGILIYGTLQLDPTQHYIVRLSVCPNDFFCIYGSASQGKYEFNGREITLEEYDKDGNLTDTIEGYFSNRRTIHLTWLGSHWIFYDR